MSQYNQYNDGLSSPPYDQLTLFALSFSTAVDPTQTLTCLTEGLLPGVVYEYKSYNNEPMLEDSLWMDPNQYPDADAFIRNMFLRQPLQSNIIQLDQPAAETVILTNQECAAAADQRIQESTNQGRHAEQQLHLVQTRGQQLEAEYKSAYEQLVAKHAEINRALYFCIEMSEKKRTALNTIRYKRQVGQVSQAHIPRFMTVIYWMSSLGSPIQFCLCHLAKVLPCHGNSIPFLE